MKFYYEVYGSKGSDSGPYGFKVYSYDANGEQEIIKYRSPLAFRTENLAMDAAACYLEENDFEAELS